jgi:glycosyltransferase involved in cell wall biosynthesis
MTHHRSGSANRPAILQAVPRLDTGGAERAAIEIAGALARAGFVPLVASQGGRMVAQLEAAGGEWIPMPLDSKSPPGLAANARGLRRLIRTRGVKLVHARSRGPAWSALWAARKERAPFVTTFHGAYSAGSAIKRFYNSVMLRGDAVIANSRWTAEHIRSTYSVQPKKLVIIPRGVDCNDFDPARVPHERVNRLRDSWGARESQTVILLPGRITRWKGQLVFVEALAQLAQNGMAQQLRAVLAGDAQGRDVYAAEVKRSIERGRLADVVTMAGHVQDMPAAYLAADIVVSASTEPEAFGRVAAEASAMERAVIATDHGGARETILPGISGILVPPDDAAALATALEQLLRAAPEARSAMGEQGRSHIMRHFSLARMTADTLALYQELLSGMLCA